MRISDWSSDVCSSDLLRIVAALRRRLPHHAAVVGQLRLLPVVVEALAPHRHHVAVQQAAVEQLGNQEAHAAGGRSEEHTSELQSLMRISYAVFCLKKKKKQTNRREL